MGFADFAGESVVPGAGEKGFRPRRGALGAKPGRPGSKNGEDRRWPLALESTRRRGITIFECGGDERGGGGVAEPQKPVAGFDAPRREVPTGAGIVAVKFQDVAGPHFLQGQRRQQRRHGTKTAPGVHGVRRGRGTFHDVSSVGSRNGIDSECSSARGGLLSGAERRSSSGRIRRARTPPC